MAIKLYKSQLDPTTQSSNVLDQRKISLSEAGSIGRAFKGFAGAGEKLYVKHQEIKSDKEVLEKIKTVMNGENGLAAVKINAANMDDPDKAMAYYNNEIEKVRGTASNSFTGLFSKKKFNTWLTKQSIEDNNSIKVATTRKLIENRKTAELDYLETLKKKVIFAGSDLERTNATNELNNRLSSNTNVELFGAGLDQVKKAVSRDIAFYGYKNVPLNQQQEALEAAKNDDRLTTEDVLKLEKAFKTSTTTSNNLNKENVSLIKSNLDKGILPDETEMATAIAIATNNGDEKTLIKLNQIATDAPIIASLTNMSVAEIENKINIYEQFKTKNGSLSIKDANQLRISQEYLAKLVSDRDSDVLRTANERGVIAIQEIGFESLLEGGDIETFKGNITNRIANAETAAAFYKTDVKYLTTSEAATIKATFDKIETSDQLIAFTTSLVSGFGSKSDKVFSQISKDDAFMAHLGGLVMMNNSEPGNNAKLAAQGYLLSKNPELASVYKMKSTDAKLLTIKGKYAQAFGKNLDTLNSTMEVANYIYAATLRNEGKSTNDFKAKDWEKALHLAAGGSVIEKIGRDTKMGGFDETTRDTMVHIPGWLENGKFTDVTDMLKEDPALVIKASSNGKAAIDINGNEFKNIFTNQDPYFVSVGNGKYIIANGDNPHEFGSDPEYLLNSDGGYFVINLNNIKSEIITRMN